MLRRLHQRARIWRLLYNAQEGNRERCSKICLQKMDYSVNPDFTKNNYKVDRGMFHTLDNHHIDYFKGLLGDDRLIMDLSDLEQYNVDWMNQLRGNSKIVLRPKTTEEVSKILSYCNQNRLAVCPQGGNTSIVGGSVPVLDEVIISTSMMNQILHIDETAGVIVCQAGCILQNLDEALAEHDLMMPLDLGAKGSCHIGGNVSTNAGGLRLLRYGNMHGNVLGLEIVKADGAVLDCLSTLKKDNTGYHLKHLFIGSEGTLGFITKVAVQCPVRPKAVNVAFLGLQSFDKVLTTFKQAKADLGEILSAVEVMDGATLKFAQERIGITSPIGEYPFYLLLESSGSNEEHDAEKLNKFVDLILVKHYALNGIVASEPSKIKSIWEIRERLPETFTKAEHVFCYDFTFPLNDYFTLIDEFRQYLKQEATSVFGFGHLGDGNLHMQIAVPEYSELLRARIEERIFKRVVELKGSISAEHGIGFLKAKHLKDIKEPSTLKFMRDMKTLMDPTGILNPYKTVYIDK